METKSIWEKYSKKTEIKILKNNLDIDVAIVGGGMTGLSTGYFLKNSNLKACIFERGKIAEEITSKTTGKITFLQENILTEIENIYSRNRAEKYYKSQKCAIEREENILKSFGEEVESIKKLPDGLEVDYGIKVSNTFVFNPIKYLYAIKKRIKDDINIYENSKVTKIEKQDNNYILTINNYKVRAKKVVIASHYPYFLFPYLMPLKCSLEKSYIGVFKTVEKCDFSAISYSNPVLSLRYLEEKEEKYKFILTNSHNISVKPNEKENFSKLKSKNPSYLWSNIDIITKDYMPYIGEIDKNLFIATGYNTWGMTNSTLAGTIISDLILKKENIYAHLFNPKRHNNINGTKVAIYKDENNIEHVVKANCPHLGCGLIFNEIEKTWDCPCHGSRFDLDGHAIAGPSNYDISFK